MFLLTSKVVTIIPLISVNLVIVMNLLTRPDLHSVVNIGHMLHATVGLLAAPPFLISSLDIITG